MHCELCNQKKKANTSGLYFGVEEKWWCGDCIRVISLKEELKRARAALKLSQRTGAAPSNS